jgi:serine phosphatase RsbU (regulator of sigma subunit)
LDRLTDVLRAGVDKPCEAILDDIIEAIDAFAGEAPQFDDITLLVLKRTA